MNKENLEYLKNGLKYLGFGETLHAPLENMIKEQPLQFQLKMVGEFNTAGPKEKVDYTLDFKKSDQSDMYFFNRYQATLKNDDPQNERTQTFYITKNSGITAKEAFNLLSGRAIHKDLTNKEGQPFNAWLQLDLQEKDKNNNYKVKQYHQGYGYDLDAVLKRYPIKELGGEDDKAKLIKSLEKGNVQQVTFVREGKEDKMFAEANPQYKSLNLYDHRMEKVFQGVDKKEKHDVDVTSDKKEKVKQESDDDGPGKQKSSKRKGVGI